jgi:RNA polymerase sigma factor (sigma-70 family)
MLDSRSMVPEGADRVTVEGFLAGDRSATDKVMEYIDAALRPWRRRFGNQTAEADDIRSDSVYKLLISFRQGDFEYRSKLATYVSTIVSRTCIEHKRFNDRFLPEDIDEMNLPSSLPSEEDELQKRQAAKLNFRVLRLLRRKCIELWHMRLKDNLTCREIGERLDKTEGNIRRQMWECREDARKMREKLLKKDKLL